MDLKGWLVDSTIAVALFVALLAVSFFDRAPRAPAGVHIEAVKEEPVVQAKALRLAVTPRQYDDMGKLLKQLGAGYPFTTIALEDLEDAEKVGRYDVIFATCGTVPDSW